MVPLRKFYDASTRLFLVLVLSTAGLNLVAGGAGQPQEKLPTVDERLDASFNLIFSDPNSATAELKSLGKGLPGYTKSQKAKYHNVNAVFLAVTGREDLAEKSFLKSLEYTDEKDPSRANTLNNLAIIHKNRGDYTEAFALLDRSMAIYEEEEDAEGMAKAHSERASIYKLLGLQDLAVDHLLKAVSILEKSKKVDQRVLVMTKQRLANTYLSARDYSFAIKLYDEVLPAFQRLDNQLDYAATLLNKAEAEFQLNRSKESLALISKALPILEGFQNHDLLSLAYLNQANAYKASVPEKAESSFKLGFAEARKGEGIYGTAIALGYAQFLKNQARPQDAQSVLNRYSTTRPIDREDMQSQAQYYGLRGDIRASLGNHRGAQSDFVKALALRDSLYDDDLFERSRALQAQYKSDLLEEENQQMASELRLNRLIALLTSILAIALVGVGGYAVYVNRLKTRLKQTELSRLEQETRMLNENVALKEEIIAQQKAQLIGSALETSQWMEKFQLLAAKAEGLGIESMRLEIEAAAAPDKHWTVFIERFRQLNPEFMEVLSTRFPELTKGELEFCSMARMNLSFKEIAHLLNISHQSVHMKKYRITKKMNLQGDDDFYALLRSF
jgi:tetratricopeptide (TPR) repeat protein/DNA-binding CsgD family transcriptional regulator